MAIKYNDLYMDLRRRLREAGAEDATQAARELVCTASGKTKNELLRDGLLYASPEVERSAYSLCARHLAGEPVAYLIGEWEFYGLGLDISPAVLIPRPDTEVLVQTVVHELDSGADCRVLDLCAGSGCIGLAVASQVLRSRVLLIQFTGIGCGPCHASIPFLRSLEERYTPADVGVVAIETWGTPLRSIGVYVRRNRINYPMLAGTDETVDAYLPDRAVPVYLLVDAERRMRHAFRGYTPAESDRTITEAIDSLLHEQ